LHALQSSLLMRREDSSPVELRAERAPLAEHRTEPATVVLPVAAIRMAAVARGHHTTPSPWLNASTDAQLRLRLVAPPQPTWSRLPLVGGFLSWLAAEYRAYKWSLRARLAL
jgi:hypothetical protein